jgi:DNA-binding MarR family transcriptional regulator
VGGQVDGKQQPGETNSHGRGPVLTKAEYERLASFRYALRRLARQTELEARRVGLSPQQYLLLLNIKGFPGRTWASITELAERLQIRHNAVIGLVNRAEERGWVSRQQDPDASDRRVVQIHMTADGDALLQRMAKALHNEREHVRMAIDALDEGE